MILICLFFMRKYILHPFKLGKWKAPRPDGLAIGLVLCGPWSILGKEVTTLVKGMVSSSHPIENFNYSDLVFIPKGKVQSTSVDFRRISLCNLIYKILSKVLCNRLIKVLPNLISPNQCAFMKG